MISKHLDNSARLTPAQGTGDLLAAIQHKLTPDDARLCALRIIYRWPYTRIGTAASLTPGQAQRRVTNALKRIAQGRTALPTTKPQRPILWRTTQTTFIPKKQTPTKDLIDAPHA